MCGTDGRGCIIGLIQDLGGRYCTSGVEGRMLFLLLFVITVDFFSFGCVGRREVLYGLVWGDWE